MHRFNKHYISYYFFFFDVVLLAFLVIGFVAGLRAFFKRSTWAVRAGRYSFNQLTPYLLYNSSC